MTGAPVIHAAAVSHLPNPCPCRCTSRCECVEEGKRANLLGIEDVQGGDGEASDDIFTPHLQAGRWASHCLPGAQSSPRAIGRARTAFAMCRCASTHAPNC